VPCGGYFYYNLSDALKSTINPFVPFRDEQGAEGFCDVLVTRWLHIAGDAQYIGPGAATNDNAFAGGVRLKVRF